MADWLNRTDLTEQVQDFIYLAERKIFRWYRNANNEKLITIDMRRNPDVGDPNQVSINSQIDLPDDYLESLTLQLFIWDSTAAGAPDPTANPGVLTEIGRPLRRVSQTELQQRRFRASRNNGAGQLPGEPEVFARTRDALQIFPRLDSTSDAYVTFQYYCDLSGLFDTPSSDNNVLKTAPDLYIYGSLLEAEPYLKPEDSAYQMLPVWKGMYEEAKQQIIDQTEQEVFSGSVNEINNSFGSEGLRSTPTNREGWA